MPTKKNNLKKKSSWTSKKILKKNKKINSKNNLKKSSRNQTSNEMCSKSISRKKKKQLGGVIKEFGELSILSFLEMLTRLGKKEKTKEDAKKKVDEIYMILGNILKNAGEGVIAHNFLEMVNTLGEGETKKYADTKVEEIYEILGDIMNKDEGYKTANNFLEMLTTLGKEEKTKEYAQIEVGKIYLILGNILKNVGEDLEKNDDNTEGDLYKEEAVRFFKMASDKGNQYAQMTLGYIYMGSRMMVPMMTGVKQNIPEAIRFFKMASDTGNEYAQAILGYIYLKEGVYQDISEAVKFFVMASENGNQDAQMKLGDIYETGIYTNKDIYKAIKFFEMAARGRYSVWHEIASMKLGSIYRNGENGQEKDIYKAIEHFEIAADKGNVPALMELADIYTYGEGVEKNYQTALEYYNNVLTKGASSQSQRQESIRMRRQIYFIKVLTMSLMNNKKEDDAHDEENFIYIYLIENTDPDNLKIYKTEFNLKPPYQYQLESSIKPYYDKSFIKRNDLEHPSSLRELVGIPIGYINWFDDKKKELVRHNEGIWDVVKTSEQLVKVYGVFPSLSKAYSFIQEYLEEYESEE